MPSGLWAGAGVVAVTVLAFALLIVVHELGHFLAARACRASSSDARAASFAPFFLLIVAHFECPDIDGAFR